MLAPPRRPGGGQGAGTIHQGTLGSVEAAGYIAQGGIDPATLALTLWEAPNYGGLPWAGTASAGTSGTSSLTSSSAGENPPVGATLNGYAPAYFNSATTSRRANASPSALSTYVNANGYSILMVAKVNSIPNNVLSPLSSAYNNAGLMIGTNGTWGVTLRMTAGPNTGPYYVQTWQYDGTDYDGQETVISLGSYTLIQSYYDGSSVYTRTDSGIWTSRAQGNIQAGQMAQSVIFGQNYTLGVAGRPDFYLMEVMVSKSVFSQATFDALRSSYFSPKYGLPF